MNRLLIALSMIIATSHATSSAATLSFSYARTLTPSAEAIMDGAPTDTKVYKFYVTTDADILGIDNVKVTLPRGTALFQVAPPFGSDVEPAPPEFIALNHALEVDSWISTPGVTFLLGTGLPGDGTGSWGDFTSNGPQTDFQFAQLAMPRGAPFSFEARVNLTGLSRPESFQFNFTPALTEEPEPAALSLVIFGVIGTTFLGRLRRRVAGGTGS